jgi:hypothetical protein
MGLVSNYVSYRIGKSRGERKARRRNPGASACYDERCDNYHYCSASDNCDGQCTYENEEE